MYLPGAELYEQQQNQLKVAKDGEQDDNKINKLLKDQPVWLTCFKNKEQEPNDLIVQAVGKGPSGIKINLTTRNNLDSLDVTFSHDDCNLFESVQALWWALDPVFSNLQKHKNQSIGSISLPQSGVPQSMINILGSRELDRRSHLQLYYQFASTVLTSFSQSSSSSCSSIIPFPRKLTTTNLPRGDVVHPLRQPYTALNDDYFFIRKTSIGTNSYFYLSKAVFDDHEKLYKWLNIPRVSRFWGTATQDEAKTMMQNNLNDPHIMPVIGTFADDADNIIPAGYFEIYWSLEDKIGEFYDADDYDRGIHMLIGEQSCRGPHRVQIWLPTLCHFMFCNDHRTRRIVSEPDHRNQVMISYMEKYGFKRIKDFDFPHKRASLMMLDRDTFFDSFPGWV